jgi:hypothetical protein
MQNQIETVLACLYREPLQDQYFQILEFQFVMSEPTKK